MTSRELIHATMEFRNTDGRAPRDMFFLPWTQNNHPNELARIKEKYPGDNIEIAPAYRSASAVEKGDPFEVGEYTDPWGCRFKSVYRGIMGEVKEPQITDDEWADASRVVFPEYMLDYDISRVNAACAASDKFMRGDCGVRPFERLQFIRGTENFYIDLMCRPKGMLDFMEKLHDFYCRLYTKMAQTDVDALFFMDDWGAQRSMLISPKLWRELFKPMYRDYIDIAHRYGKKTVMHSDGYILDIIPDLIDLGLDALNCQIFCMGPEKLAQFKGRITFWGEICRQQILPYGTVQDVQRAVRSVYDNLWDDGGCIAYCEFGLGAKPENVEAVFETWDQLTGQ